MKLSELRQKFVDHSIDRVTHDGEEHKAVRRLFSQFTPISKIEIHNNQIERIPDGMQPFFNQQDDLFVKLIDMEISEFGKAVREAVDLEPLTPDTEI